MYSHAALFQEFDTPAALFSMSDGIFRGMCERSAITLDDIKLAAKAKTDNEQLM
jgi:hypothetical protein